MERKLLLVNGGAIVLVLVAACIAYFTKSNAFVGSAINPPVTAGGIALTDSNGVPFQLESTRGKVTVVFFGYTNCPDECPLTMAKLKQVMGELGDRSKDVQVLLVTTDPVRDTPAQLKQYVTKFYPTFLGLTGTAEQLQAVWTAYGVVVLDGGETHSEQVYVIDRKGNLRLTFPAEMTYQDIAHDLKQLLAEQ